jgi:NAD(P)-dependent dehydrogenase (short-subunit alcohol dehydrogenase family)
MSISLEPLGRQLMVITSASGGIALATGEAAAEQKARLMLAARSEEALQAIDTPSPQHAKNYTDKEPKLPTSTMHQVMPALAEKIEATHAEHQQYDAAPGNPDDVWVRRRSPALQQHCGFAKYGAQHCGWSGE